MRLCEPHQALSRPVHQLGIGRKGDRLLLHGGVEDHLGEVGGLGRAGAGGDGQALLQERQQPLLAEALAPARQRRALERQLVLKELLATEQLEIRVLQPARTERLVGEIVQVLEDGQAGHQPGRQRWPAGIIVVKLAEARLEKAPVDRARERHQRVGQVDDLIEPRPEQIRLAALASLLRSHRPLPRCVARTVESRDDTIQFAGNRCSKPRYSAKSNPKIAHKPKLNSSLPSCSRRLKPRPRRVGLRVA